VIHADRTLAARLEGLICAEFRRLEEVARQVFPDSHAESLDVAGGVALWLGEGSPVNRAAGQGMAGLVSDGELERLEAFYHARGADAITSVCAFADPSLILGLGRRGWRATESEHVLVSELDEATHWDGRGSSLDVRVCSPSERELWAQIAGLGFSDGEPPGQGNDEFGLIMAAREEVVLVLGFLEGRPAGTGALVIDGGVGWLSGDSTLPRYRRQGVQQVVQTLRLRLARDAGCALAATEAAPGTGSQRNMERLGFRIAYTHVEFGKPAGPTPGGAASGR
jgi:GNAT superfamily N-acetyltransferase